MSSNDPPSPPPPPSARYVEDGAYKGRPLYTNKATGNQIWWNGQWRVGKTNDYFYDIDAKETSVCGTTACAWKVSTFHPNAATCEPAPTVQPGTVVMAGAGCAIVNGTYAVDGAYKGRPLYTNKETSLQIWWNGQWRVGKTNDYYYDLHSSEVSVLGSESNPWKKTDFHPNAATCEPAPAACVLSETCPA